ncbi:hypothetical protein Ddye_018747 [Dipteronia dyeriana]|uniref:Endonuclease/exonuclease/phosphatase domain-containing protein n=1 Tax=Dipteronia dyeriana TaxID=168575 RepID=A0AAD9X1Z1_9ROSI|nr:hypothetical protein Ddye_018747 [Dipteronia dyeriana]
MGDFNEVLSDAEKERGHRRDWSYISTFQEALDGCGLEDMGYVRLKFTWCNKRDGSNMIHERLDRFTNNLGWRNLFPNYMVKHLDFRRSDHRPLLLEVNEESFDSVLASVEPRLSGQSCEFLDRPFTYEEIETAVFGMEPTKGQRLLEYDIRWRVGDRAKIVVYKDRWILKMSTLKVLSPPTLGEIVTVLQLILPSGGWDVRLVTK